jgi:hypothetical protein
LLPYIYTLQRQSETKVGFLVPFLLDPSPLYVFGRHKYSLLPGPYNPKQARKIGVNTEKRVRGYIQFLTRMLNEVPQLKQTTKYSLICSIYINSNITCSELQALDV